MRFDIDTPLTNGQILIEASAGTGKTYAIANIYLRLILERNLHPSKILVVTFTVPATAELRDRLRKNLKDAYKYISDKDDSVDKNILDIVENCLKKRTEIETKKILYRSILDFDEAAIFTIHSFCLNMLSENAFESGSLFDIEMVKDQDEIIDEVIEDYWRCQFYNSSVLSEVIQASGITIGELKESAYYIVKNPDVLFLPEDRDNVTPEELCSTINEQMCSIVAYWKNNEDILIEAFATVPLKMASKRDRFQPLITDFKVVVGQGMASSAKLYSIKLFTEENLRKECSAKKSEWQAEGCLKVFTDLCEELKEIFDTFVVTFKYKLFNDIKLNNKLSEKKKKIGVRSYIDLLTQMRAGLCLDGRPNSNHPLAVRIRNQFEAALIDEFQDTDPIQFEIFKTIFDYPGIIMFMIGDPKQSIYRFRGADIFAYLEAKNNPKITEYTLDTNYRTVEPLIGAVDQWFDNKYSPGSFVYDELYYNGVKAAEVNRFSRIEIEGETSNNPCELNYSFAQTKPIALNNCALSTANKIAELLNLADESKAKIIITDSNGVEKTLTPITPGIIAVLVRKNIEAGIIHQALSKVNVPSVVQSTGNIFKTDEALDLLRVLEAINENNNSVKLKTALCGKLIGLTPFDIFQMTSTDNSNDYEYWLELFAYYKELWQEKSFIRMFYSFLEPEEDVEVGSGILDFRKQNARFKKNVKANLLLNAGGERSLTNILHLAELIHKESINSKLGIDGVIQWLFDKINSDKNELESEEYEIRLDSDSEAVQIITIHSSKGLEYPIVFCPFLWTKGIKPHSSSGLRNYAFHKNGKQYCDLADPKSHEAEVEKENLAEEIRLMYVAMTRAVYKLYIHYAEVKSGGSRQTAIYYLLNSMINGKLDINSGQSVSALLKKKSIDISSLKLINTNIDIASCSKPVSDYRYIPNLNSDTTSKQFTFKKLINRAHIIRNWGVMSYSSLVDGSHNSSIGNEQNFGEDDSPSPSLVLPPDISKIETVEHSETSFFNFPRKGRFTGSFCHEVLELIKFDSVRDGTWKNNYELKSTIEIKLLNYGLINGKKGTEEYTRLLELRYAQVFEMLTKVLSTPIPEINNSFSLQKLTENSLTREMEFYYPVNRRIDPRGINEAFSKYSFKSLRSDSSLNAILNKAQIKFKKGMKLNQGYMTGSIDLVFTYQGKFYIADWKGSWLGSAYENYTKQSLLENMAASGYFLQHNLYALALNCLLKTKVKGYNLDPEKSFADCFGGVLYFYIRGMNGIDPDYGYIFDKPEFKHINKLSNEIIGKR